MTTKFVVLIDNAEDVGPIKKLIEKNKFDLYEHPKYKRCLFVGHTGVQYYGTQEMTVALNMQKEKGKSDESCYGGIVIKINAGYGGFTERALWDWLQKDV